MSFTQKIKKWISFSQTKQILKVVIIACGVIFIISLLGSYFAVKQHNETVRIVLLNPRTIYGTVIDRSSPDGLVKTAYEFQYKGQKYEGSCFDDFYYPIGSSISIIFNADKPFENVYYEENKIVEMNYFLFASKTIGAFLFLLLIMFGWKLIPGNKQ